jgi:hypothetical protein
VLEAPDEVAPVEVAVLLADAFDVEAELSDLDDDSEAEETEAADVTDAEEAADEDEAAAEVAAAPVPVDVRTAVRRDPTSPLATQVPATFLLISYAPTIPVSQQNPFPLYPLHKLQEESAHLGEPSTSPRQSLAVDMVSKVHFLKEVETHSWSSMLRPRRLRQGCSEEKMGSKPRYRKM